MQKGEYWKLNIEEANILLRHKDISSYELTGSIYKRISQKEKEINAYTTLIDKTSVLRKAKESDERHKKSGYRSKLDGIPFSIKDSFVTENVYSTAGSCVLKNYIGQYNATVYQKLIDSGAILLGKNNLDEFCMGFTTETSCFGTTSNPYDTKRVAGGSSGGSAAAVAAGECIFFIGSEHYDSIRQPAAWCGVVGFKPTYGAVSRYGIIAMASSLECPGPITKTVKDAATVLSIIYGKDEHDANTFSPHSKAKFKIKDIQMNLRIGLAMDYLDDFVDREVLKVFKNVLKVFKELGIEVKEIKLPPIKDTTSIFEVLYRSEVASNLSRYDGIRYPLLEEKQSNIEEQYNVIRKKFGPLLKYLMISELRSLSGAEFDGIYKDALRMRALIDVYFKKVFEKVDLIISPMSPCIAFKKGFYKNGKYLSNKNTDKYKPFIDMVAQLPSLSGFPGISVPCGLADGMPVGLNIYGPRFAEQKILDLAYLFEQNRLN